MDSPPTLGVVTLQNGVNFAVHAPGTPLTLKLFHEGNPSSFFSKCMQKTGSVQHLFVKDLSPPFLYAFECSSGKLLLDPYAKEISSSTTWGSSSSFLGKVSKKHSFDWEGIKRPHIPKEELIIYEMHVRGFTKSALAGTFSSMKEKIPHLISLGINAVELLPVMEFDECETFRKNPVTKKPLYNFWGYSSINFFSLMGRYATSSPIEEFKDLVKALHKAKIAVILDVVYNHTSEGNEEGPTLSFKGLDKEGYYLLSSDKKHMNFSGTGNTCNCNQEPMQSLIIDSLTYFAKEFQIDGFRFDLASILTRGKKGEPLSSPPLIEAIEKAPSLQGLHLITEPWDAGGLYQVGSFPGSSLWSEWNGKYRDTLRQFIKGDQNQTKAFADALLGSEELYKEQTPLKSINFITAHDGYTLYDLVSYQKRHNDENGEENRDGNQNNLSWNCGQEGPSNSEDINSLRLKQMKNFHLALCLSLGVPMLLMGDEYGHTRKGNNNPYCQDNSLNWFDWEALEKGHEHFAFLQKVLAFRKRKKHLFCQKSFIDKKLITWHGIKPNTPDWSPKSKFIAYEIGECFIAFNASHEKLSITLPSTGKWRSIFNTAYSSFTEATLEGHYVVDPYSAFVAELDS